MSIIYETAADAMRRLAELGVAVESIQRSVGAGHVARLTCTENDPPFIPGTEAWRYVVVTLREELCPRGWRKSDPGNFSLVSNDARRINIIVASGDALTRRVGGDPRTRSLKGLYTEAATVRNSLQGDLFPETLTEDVRRVAALLEYPTWVLLTFITNDEARAELSRPTAIVDGQITEWAERIFIPDAAEPPGGLAIDSDGGDGTPEIDVPVRRRA